MAKKPEVGMIAHHLAGILDSRPVAEVSEDGSKIKVRINHLVTKWLPAGNYRFTKARS